MGNCRLVSALAIQLSETVNTWRRLMAPVAEDVAQGIWSSVSKSLSQKITRQLIATRLTPRNKREVKGSDVPQVRRLKPEHVCSGCGVTIPPDGRRCSECSKPVTDVNFRAGRKSAQQPESLAKRASTMRRHKQAIQNWKPSEPPTGLPAMST